MNWPAILAPLLAPNFLVTVLVALDCIDAAMWWTAVAGAGAIFTVRGQAADQQQARALQR